MHIFFLKYTMHDLRDLRELQSHPFFDSNTASRIENIKNVELNRIDSRLQPVYVHNMYMELKSRLDRIQNLEKEKLILDSNSLSQSSTPKENSMKKKTFIVDYVFIAPNDLANKIIKKK